MREIWTPPILISALESGIDMNFGKIKLAYEII